MNYIDPLLISTFMSVIYYYVLVFVDCLTKMRHLVTMSENCMNCQNPLSLTVALSSPLRYEVTFVKC